MMLCPRMAISPMSSAVFQSASMRRISTPQIGVPIEPALAGLPGWLNEATGAVSERP